jgi:hypothetical protein
MTGADTLTVGWAVSSEGRTAQSHKRKEPVMKEKLRFLGLDVHSETIAVAVAEPDGEVRSLGMIPNRFAN